MALRSAVLLAVLVMARTQVQPPSYSTLHNENHHRISRQTNSPGRTVAKVIPFAQDPSTVSLNPQYSLLRSDTSRMSLAPQPNVYNVPLRPQSGAKVGCPRDDDMKSKPTRTPPGPTDPFYYMSPEPAYPLRYPPWMWSNYYYPRWRGYMPAVYVPAPMPGPLNPRRMQAPWLHENKSTEKPKTKSQETDRDRKSTSKESTTKSSFIKTKLVRPETPTPVEESTKSSIENRRAARHKQHEDAAKVINYLIDWGTKRKSSSELDLDEGDTTAATYVTYTDRSRPANVYPLPKISVGGKPQPITVYDKRKIFTDLKKP